MGRVVGYCWEVGAGLAAGLLSAAHVEVELVDAASPSHSSIGDCRVMTRAIRSWASWARVLCSLRRRGLTGFWGLHSISSRRQLYTEREREGRYTSSSNQQQQRE